MSQLGGDGYLVAMGELRLYAIGVDEVRDVFCASPELAEQFRRIVADEFPPQTTPKAPGMLGKLGPLFRKPAGAVLVRPDTPVESDVADLLAGRFIAPERQPVAWRLIECYLAATAWSGHHIALDMNRFNDLEFDLARAGLDPRFGLGKLVNRELGVPLQTYPACPPATRRTRSPWMRRPRGATPCRNCHRRTVRWPSRTPPGSPSSTTTPRPRRRADVRCPT